jgi:hypothetical protein
MKFIGFICSGCHGIETIESGVIEWKAKLENRNCELITKSQEATHSQVFIFLVWSVYRFVLPDVTIFPTILNLE